MSVVMENLMSIGEFASASRLSQKALRLYGENGVLPPGWVDPETGYRYYRLEQLHTATLLALLRRSGMPLADIRSFLREPSVERLEAYEREVADEFADRRRVLRYVKRILKEEPMYDVITTQADEQPYVSRTKQVLVPELEPFIVRTFRELGLDPDGAPGFVLYHGPVNTEEDGPVEVCVPNPMATSGCLPARSRSQRFEGSSASSRRSSARTRRCIAGPRKMAARRRGPRARSTCRGRARRSSSRSRCR